MGLLALRILDTDPTEIVPPELAAVHDRLTSWAAWLLRRPAPRRCESIEGSYRSSQVWDLPGAPQRIRSPMTDRALDAIEVEHAVAMLPILERALIRQFYVFRSPPWRWRKLGAPRDLQGCADLLNGARAMVAERIFGEMPESPTTTSSA